MNIFANIHPKSAKSANLPKSNKKGGSMPPLQQKISNYFIVFLELRSKCGKSLYVLHQSSSQPS